MAKALPYYKMWPKDFDTDEHVRLLDLAETGLFLFCLNHAWNNDGLPDDLVMIARLLKIPEEKFLSLWPAVSRCFEAGEDGRLRNPRQEVEREGATKRSAQCSEAAQSRRGKRRREVDYSSALPDPAYPRVEATIIAGRTFEERFESLYERHPKKSYREAAANSLLTVFQNWEARAKRAKVDTLSALFLLIDMKHERACASESWRKSNGDFAPKLHQWLDDEGYLANAGDIEPPKDLL
jgi:uncharacterized protein YdaU (DUF1376 family)